MIDLTFGRGTLHRRVCQRPLTIGRLSRRARGEGCRLPESYCTKRNKDPCGAS
jgi:hypothetical protein